MVNRWDAREAGCGELAVGLHARLARLEPGATLGVVVADEGARRDLFAWCRMTGHTLVSAEPPCYALRRRED